MKKNILRYKNVLFFLILLGINTYAFTQIILDRDPNCLSVFNLHIAFGYVIGALLPTCFGLLMIYLVPRGIKGILFLKNRYSNQAK